MNQIDIYGDIGESFWSESITDTDVKALLDQMEGDVTVRINSPGGSVFDGFAIYNLLKQHDGEIHVKIDALAASAASVIAMAGDSIEMADNSLMMIHEPWSMALGDSSEMRKTAELLDKIRDSIVTTYKSKTDLSDDEIKQMMVDETWFNADEAIESGFATAKTGETGVMNSMARPWMNKAPEIKQEKPDAAFLNVQRNRIKLLKADA